MISELKNSNDIYQTQNDFSLQTAKDLLAHNFDRQPIIELKRDRATQTQYHGDR